MGSPADRNAFNALLALASSQSPHFAQLLQDIRASGAPVRVVLRHGPHKGLFDSFANDTVYLNDLRQLPASAGPGDAGITRGQTVAHFLAERFFEALHHTGFDADHAQGIAEENLFRQDTHQPRITNTLPANNTFLANHTYTVFFSDGTEEEILFDAHDHLTGIHFMQIPPFTVVPSIPPTASGF